LGEQESRKYEIYFIEMQKKQSEKKNAKKKETSKGSRLQVFPR